MIDAEQIIQRLKLHVPLAKTVEHAWFMSPLEELDKETPAIFIYPGPEKAQESDLDALISQQVEGALVVYLVAQHSQLDAMRELVRKTLLGWQQDPTFNGLQFLSGEREGANAKYIWWKDIFSDQFHIRESLP